MMWNDEDNNPYGSGDNTFARPDSITSSPTVNPNSPGSGKLVRLLTLTKSEDDEKYAFG